MDVIDSFCALGEKRDMGVFKKIGDFLFGKDPDVFDETGRVRHQFSEEKWKAWDERIKANPDYDWRRHSATERLLKSDANPQIRPEPHPDGSDRSGQKGETQR